MIGTDPAKLYGIPTQAFNRAVKRNQGHLPSDFMFQLTPAEKAEAVTNCGYLNRLLVFSTPMKFA